MTHDLLAAHPDRDPAGPGQCSRHEKRDQRRRLREGGGYG